MRKVVLIILVLLGGVVGGTAKADLGKVDYWNWSYDEGTGEEAAITEQGPSGEYMNSYGLMIYGWGPTVMNPTDHAINPTGIEQNKAYVLEFRLEAKPTMPNNKDNVIDINWNYPEGIPTYTPFERLGRNFFMRQHPYSPRTGTSEEDPNIYDLLDLTNNFTANAQITLPNITSSTPRTPAIYDKWQKIITNYADISPSITNRKLSDGKVNLKDFSKIHINWLRSDCNTSNNWCNYSDLNRNGNVNVVDVKLSSGQWLCDPNTIR